MGEVKNGPLDHSIVLISIFLLYMYSVDFFQSAKIFSVPSKSLNVVADLAAVVEVDVAHLRDVEAGRDDDVEALGPIY
jgi:hypothetical protein